MGITTNIGGTKSVAGASSLDFSARVIDKKLARFRSLLLLLVADLAAIVAGYLLADAIYWGETRYAEIGGMRTSHGVLILTMIAPLYICISAMNRTYSLGALAEPRASTFRSIQSLMLAAAMILFLAYFLKAGSEFSRAVFGIGLGASVAMLLGARALASRAVNRLMVGDPQMVVVIRDGIDYERSGTEVVLTPAQLGFDPETSDPFHYHAFANAVAHADRLIVACPRERQATWSSALKSMAIVGELVTDEHDPIGIIGIAEYGGRRTLIVASGPLGLRARLIKRTFDLCFAGPAAILLAPLLIATAIAIRLESRGPVFFMQNRIGQDNKIFRMFKFRSMYVDQCDIDAAKLTTRNDPRVTRVGNFIRRTSIDELPQLFNVLMGDMSIVGPRPHPLSAKAADLLYWDADPRYRHRHAIKPGLTGLAQIRGFRGNTERVEDLTNRLEADLEYVLDWSLMRDVQIIFQTLFVLRHQNAF